MCDHPDPDLLEKAKSNPRLEPFLHTIYEKTLYEKFKFYIFPGPIFTFLRLGFFFCCLFLHHILQRLVFLGYSDWEKPAPRWRRRGSQLITKYCTALGMFANGYYHLKLVDHTRKSKSEEELKKYPPFEFDQPYPLCGNHISETDILVLCSHFGNPSFAAKSAMFNAPLISFLTKSFRCLKVVRKEKIEQSSGGAPEKKQLSTSEILVSRIKNPIPNDYTPLIFPEGTTGSGRYVFRFHKGAFLAGMPVRPFTIKYPAKHVSLSYDSISIYKLMYDLGSQFVNYVEVEVFDLYYPSEAEIKDPGLYARNVGAFVASKLGVKYLNNCDLLECNLLIDFLTRKKTYEEVEKVLSVIQETRVAADGGLFE